MRVNSITAIFLSFLIVESCSFSNTQENLFKTTCLDSCLLSFIDSACVYQSKDNIYVYIGVNSRNDIIMDLAAWQIPVNPEIIGFFDPFLQLSYLGRVNYRNRIIYLTRYGNKDIDYLFEDRIRIDRTRPEINDPEACNIIPFEKSYIINSFDQIQEIQIPYKQQSIILYLNRVSNTYSLYFNGFNPAKYEGVWRKQGNTIVCNPINRSYYSNLLKEFRNVPDESVDFFDHKWFCFDSFKFINGELWSSYLDNPWRLLYFSEAVDIYVYDYPDISF